MTTPEAQNRTDLEVVRSEEQLQVGTKLTDAGRVLVRKLVGGRHETHDVERHVEQAEVETVPAAEGDTGEVLTLPDGSLSIPVFEEKVVLVKQLVVRERIVVRKHSVAHREQVDADVLVEHVELVADASVSDRIDAEPDAESLVRRAPQPAAPLAGAPAPGRAAGRAADGPRVTTAATDTSTPAVPGTAPGKATSHEH